MSSLNSLKVSQEKLKGKSFHHVQPKGEMVMERMVQSSDEDNIQFNLNNQLLFDLKYTQNEQALTGFISSGKYLYRVSLDRAANNKY